MCCIIFSVAMSHRSGAAGSAQWPLRRCRGRLGAFEAGLGGEVRLMASHYKKRLWRRCGLRCGQLPALLEVCFVTRWLRQPSPLLGVQLTSRQPKLMLSNWNASSTMIASAWTIPQTLWGNLWQSQNSTYWAFQKQGNLIYFVGMTVFLDVL